MSKKKRSKKVVAGARITDAQIWSAMQGARHEMGCLRCEVLARLDQMEFLLRDRIWSVRRAVEGDKVGRNEK